MGTQLGGKVALVVLAFASSVGAEVRRIPVQIPLPHTFYEDRLVPGTVEIGRRKSVLKVPSQGIEIALESELVQRLVEYADGSTTKNYEVERATGGFSIGRLAPKRERIILRILQGEQGPRVIPFAQFSVTDFSSGRWSRFETRPRIIEISGRPLAPMRKLDWKDQLVAVPFPIGDLLAIVQSVDEARQTAQLIPVYDVENPPKVGGKVVRPEAYTIPLAALVVGASPQYYESLRGVNPRSLMAPTADGWSERPVLRPSASPRTSGVLFGERVTEAGTARELISLLQERCEILLGRLRPR